MSATSIPRSRSFDDIRNMQVNNFILVSSLNTKPLSSAKEKNPDQKAEGIFCAILQQKTLDIASLDCNHEFDKTAIYEWIKNKSKCPLCNRNINRITYKGTTTIVLRPAENNLSASNVVVSIAQNTLGGNQVARLNNMRHASLSSAERRCGCIAKAVFSVLFPLLIGGGAGIGYSVNNEDVGAAVGGLVGLIVSMIFLHIHLR